MCFWTPGDLSSCPYGKASIVASPYVLLSIWRIWVFSIRTSDSTQTITPRGQIPRPRILDPGHFYWLVNNLLFPVFRETLHGGFCWPCLTVFRAVFDLCSGRKSSKIRINPIQPYSIAQTMSNKPVSKTARNSLVYLLFPTFREMLQGGFLEVFSLFSRQFSVYVPDKNSGENHWKSLLSLSNSF